MHSNIFVREQKRNGLLYLAILLVYFIIAMIFNSLMVYYVSIKGESNDILAQMYHTLNFALKNKVEFSVVLSIDMLIKGFKAYFWELWYIHFMILMFVMIAYNSILPSEWKGAEYGTGRVANQSEKDMFKDPTGFPVAHQMYIPIKSHTYKVGRKKYEQYSPSNLNQLVISGSGGGKTLRELLPQLKQLNGNYIITDPKSEVFKNSYKFLKKHHYDVRVLNLYQIEYSNHYNPFVYVSNEQDVITLSETFMRATAEEAKRDFWTKSAQLIFSACMLYLFNSENEEKSFGRVIRLISALKFGQNGIDMGCEYAQVMTEYCNKPEHYQDMVYIKWQEIQTTPSETLGGQLTTLTTSLALWYTKAVDSLTANDELGIDDFADPNKKIVLFVIIPPADETYSAIATMFYSQLLQRLQMIANTSKTGKLPQLLNIFMDEFANISEIKSFSKFLSVTRSYNIRIMIILQSYSQLKNKYKDDYNAIVANCAIFTYLGATDKDTLELVAEKFGTATIRTETKNYNFGEQSHGGGTRNNSLTGRKYDPDEFRRYADSSRGIAKRYGGKCIVVIDMLPAFATFKYDMLHDQEYMNEFGSAFGKQVQNCVELSKIFKKKKIENDKMNESIGQERLKRNMYIDTQRNALISKEEASEQQVLEDEFINSEKDMEEQHVEKFVEEIFDGETEDYPSGDYDEEIDNDDIMMQKAISN